MTQKCKLQGFPTLKYLGLYETAWQFLHIIVLGLALKGLYGKLK